MRSRVLAAIGDADLSDGPPSEPNVPGDWPGHLVPNFGEWRRGDILLIAGDGSLPAKGVQAAQRLARQREVRAGSVYTHAGIYVGDGKMVDATYGQPIAERSVWFYCQYRALMLRRLPSLSLSADDVASIAEAALQHVGEPYSLLEAIVSKLVPGTEPNPERLYCSTFVGLVVTEATGLRLTADRRHRPLHPATLAVHPALETVDVEWRGLGTRTLAVSPGPTARGP